MQFTFHVTSLPHTNTTLEYQSCAYSQKVRKFCKMMKDRGHVVFLYGGSENEAECDEFIPCLSEAERRQLVGAGHYNAAPWCAEHPVWRIFNLRCAAAIAARSHPQDFVCVIGGLASKPIADALPHMMTVEFGVGYGGTFSKYRVFESYAWMHQVYGAQQGTHAADGNWWDTVIPNYFDLSEFPVRNKKGDYYLYIGRLIDRKGTSVVYDVCEKLGLNLKVAGAGDAPRYGEYVGEVDSATRGELMAGAIASFVPTIYIEPFGAVVVESHLCGTPTITTDWGAFTETVQNGVNGYRCRTFSEFAEATECVKKLKPAVISRMAREKYSMQVIGARYEEYFARLFKLWGKGWYDV